MQTTFGESTYHEVAGRQGLLKAKPQVDVSIDGGPRDEESHKEEELQFGEKSYSNILYYLARIFHTIPNFKSLQSDVFWISEYFGF